jgi:hypothetical protein
MNNSSKSLSVPSLGIALDRLGLAAGVVAVVDPSGLAGVAAATIPVARAVVSHLDERAEERRRSRARLLLENLQIRLANVEAKLNPPVDLFAEMLSKAIADDDERKVPFHGAVIEWIVEMHPDPALARMAMEAVSRLSYPELRSFVTWSRKGFGRLKLESGFSERVGYVRFNMLGLITQDNLIDEGRLTVIGRLLMDRCGSAAYEDRDWEHRLR